MPSGRDVSEQKWFKGWFDIVIKAAVKEAGYDLSWQRQRSSQEQSTMKFGHVSLLTPRSSLTWGEPNWRTTQTRTSCMSLAFVML